MVLIDMPSRNSTASDDTSDTGMVTAGTRVARRLPRNRKVMSTTSSTATSRDCTTWETAVDT